MEKANKKTDQISDISIIKTIGTFVKDKRVKQNLTQHQLSEMAGLNRWTISQIEKGEPISLISLIQILRALDSLEVLNAFEVSEEISPLAYAKLKKEQKKRVRNKQTHTPNKEHLGW